MSMVTVQHDEVSPILVDVIRGDMVESFHRGQIVVADAVGKIVRSLGDVDRLVYPRSAVKPIQALPLIETGAADGCGLGHEELALACASHRGEPSHVEKVGRGLPGSASARRILNAVFIRRGTNRPIRRSSARAVRHRSSTTTVPASTLAF